MAAESFFDRINFHGSPLELATRICSDYKIGKLLSFSVPPMGYEDLNLVLTTPKGPYFDKVFASSRDDAGVKRYVATMEKVLEEKVLHPSLYPTLEGGHLHEIPTNDVPLRMVLMEYIDGGTVLESRRNLTITERRQLIYQAALINSIDYKPDPVHDSWAIMSFVTEFNRKRGSLAPKEEIVIGQLAEDFGQVPFPNLPQAFVHGDIRS